MNNHKTLFHVHTFRCGHADQAADEAYVLKGIELGAEDIWFTDHAPFPGDPFRNRMRYSELPEYISTLTNLKNKYQGRIRIHIGLEIEYLPSFERTGYYRMLNSIPEMEVLLLGQHMAELSDNPLRYSFHLDSRVLEKEEFRLLGEAEIRAIHTAHLFCVMPMHRHEEKPV